MEATAPLIWRVLDYEQWGLFNCGRINSILLAGSTPEIKTWLDRREGNTMLTGHPPEALVIVC